MSRINQLSENVANLIAAGEVVLGPESVVKELVENSIDAKSTKIEINLLDAGLKEVEIKDDGIGMDKDDAVLAFSRHATSKIKTAFDLASIKSLGFRGEALPSIASVSQLDLFTKEEGTDYGIKVSLKAGKIINKETSATEKGTRIIVKNLFYNTPARLKYLKGPSVILANICNLVDKFALANSNLKITLTNNGQTLLKTNGDGNIFNLTSSIYGTQIAKAMNSITEERDGMILKAYYSSPVISRSRKNDITLIVNGRFVKSNIINNAVVDAYKNYLALQRYPVCILDLSIDPLLIDINVHPQKLEIKFSTENEVLSLIKGALLKGLKSLEIIPEVEKEPLIKPAPLTFDEYISFDNSTEKENEDAKEEVIYKPVIEKKPIINDIIEEKPVQYSKEEKKEFVRKLPYFEYIGQLSGTYLLFQNEEGLFLVDQHAAQERINYEKYFNMLKEPKKEKMELLIPYSITLTNEEAVILSSHLEMLAKYGLELEPSGISSFFIRYIPSWINSNNPEKVIEIMLYFLLEDKSFDIGKIRDSLAKQMACKASIKANHYICKEDAIGLIAQLEKCENPFNCPHGRPVFIKITLYEIEKMFKRIV